MAATRALPLLLVLLTGCGAVRTIRAPTQRLASSASGDGRILTELMIIQGEFSSCPEDFQRVGGGGLNGDFNEGSGGNFIWLCARRDPVGSGRPPITGVTVVGSGSSMDDCGGLSQAWRRIPQGQGSNGDFNEGAEGKFIFLCYTRDTNAGGPIASLDLSQTGDCGDGFGINRHRDSNGDFNQGCGGKDIYMCARRACIVSKLVGQWIHTADVPSTSTTLTVSQGTTMTQEQSRDSSWSSSVTAAVEAGFDVEGVSAKTHLEKTVSESFAHQQSQSWSMTRTDTLNVPFDAEDKGKAVWQFILLSDETCVGPRKTFTSFIAITPDASQEPCCMPGYAKDSPYYNVCLRREYLLKGAAGRCQVAA